MSPASSQTENSLAYEANTRKTAVNSELHRHTPVQATKSTDKQASDT